MESTFSGSSQYTLCGSLEVWSPDSAAPTYSEWEVALECLRIWAKPNLKGNRNWRNNKIKEDRESNTKRCELNCYIYFVFQFHIFRYENKNNNTARWVPFLFIKETRLRQRWFLQRIRIVNFWENSRDKIAIIKYLAKIDSAYFNK